VSDLHVTQPGLLSLLQDRGRFGRAALGLSNGGPMDPVAAALANRLLHNSPDATLLEVSFGGLELRAGANTRIAVCGAGLPLLIDGQERPMWTALDLREGEALALGYSETGCRTYLAVRGGFRIPESFGSTATVLREGIGGLHGRKIESGDVLPIAGDPRSNKGADDEASPRLWLPPRYRPDYHHRTTVRVIPGYQQKHFPRLDQRRFFASEYCVSSRSDRMGYRLEGAGVRCSIDGILSEGIAMGAIQVPADGQPIVLLNDRQTIGGYPKLGCALSLDCAALAQLRPGDTVNFTAISEHAAHNALHLAAVYEKSRLLEQAPR
jgi:biotin-dependent carboxylase-like uncharacterized protein